MYNQIVDFTPERKKPQDYQVEQQRAPSPPRPYYEKFFLPNISPEFLNKATNIARSRNRSRSFHSSTSISEYESTRTEDFESTADFESAVSILDCEELDDNSVEKNIYTKDPLGVSSPILEESEYREMVSKASRRKKKSKTVRVVTVEEPEHQQTAGDSVSSEDTPTASAPSDDSPHFDLAEHVYEHAKSVWSMGKDVSIFNIHILKPFLSVTEDVATKVLSATTGAKSLASVDETIKPHLKGIDNDIIDPAVVRLLNFMTPLVGKSEDTIKNLINMIKSPLIKFKAENMSPETKTTGESTLQEG